MAGQHMRYISGHQLRKPSVRLDELPAPSTAPHLCECGCGEPTPIATQTNRRRGIYKGYPLSFIIGHHRVTHRLSHTPEYMILRNAKDRCEDPELKAYRNYGAKGIKCELASAQQIIDDIGPRPPDKDAKGRAVYSLDRIDNTGNYRAGNLRWATDEQQQGNKGRKFSVRKMRENGASLTETARRVLERLGMSACRVRPDHGVSEDFFTED